MKLARIEYRGVVCEATVTCNGYVVDGPAEMAGTEVGEDEARLLPRCPGKILEWVNFREHIGDGVRAGREPVVKPAEEIPRPLLFLKPPSSLIGHREAIVYPFDATRWSMRGAGRGHRP